MTTNKCVDISELYSLDDGWNTPIQEAIIKDYQNLKCGESYAYVEDEQIKVVKILYLYRSLNRTCFIGSEGRKISGYYL